MSNLLIIAGDPGAREMPIRIAWRQTGGFEYERRWWGPADAVRALLNSGPPTGANDYDFTQQPGSPIGILTVRYSGKPNAGGEDANVSVETMTVDFNDIGFPISQNPTFVNVASYRILELEKDAADKNFDPDSYPATLEGDREREYVENVRRKHEQYRVSVPVVNWTRTVSSNYGTKLDLAGVGKVFTTSQAVDAMGAPVLFDVPTGNVGVEADEALFYAAGWRKVASLDYDGNGNLLMRITFEYGLWRKSLYQPFTGSGTGLAGKWDETPFPERTE